MSETSPVRRILHLVVEGFPAARLQELASAKSRSEDMAEIFQLTEANSREALEKIFAADTVMVWSEV